jgi:hypothetical protein
MSICAISNFVGKNIFDMEANFNGSNVTITVSGVVVGQDPFKYTANYTFKCNPNTGAIVLTYVSGDKFDVKLSLVNYGRHLAGIYLGRIPH